MEEFMYEKMQGYKPTRQLESNILGQNLIDAGNDIGPGTAYGVWPSSKTLICCHLEMYAMPCICLCSSAKES